MGRADHSEGVGPLDIIKLAFVSPLRAVVTCLFGIGLPQGLFRQLSPHQSLQFNTPPPEARVRNWRIPIPSKSPTKGQTQSRILKAIVIDGIFLVLLAIMLWQNITLGLQIVVSWRCEYTWLLICWPIACILWLIVAIVSLLILAKKIRIQYSEDAEGVDRSWIELLQLTYKLPRPRRKEGLLSETGNNIVARNRSLHPPRAQEFRIEITMRFDRAWGWYEAGIEALAVGIYLYATFVLTSSLFISGSTAIVYMTVMVLCLSTIRILEAI